VIRESSIYLVLFALVLLFLSLVFLVQKTGETQVRFVAPSTDINTTETPQEAPVASWLKRLSGSQVKDNRYPAPEITLAWDLVPPQKRLERVFLLSFPSLDRYQFFCLDQVLTEKGIIRAVSQTDTGYNVYVSLKTETAARSLKRELARYDIYATMTQEVRTKPYY